MEPILTHGSQQECQNKHLRFFLQIWQRINRCFPCPHVSFFSHCDILHCMAFKVLGKNSAFLLKFMLSFALKHWKLGGYFWNCVEYYCGCPMASSVQFLCKSLVEQRTLTPFPFSIPPLYCSPAVRFVLKSYWMMTLRTECIITCNKVLY